MKGDKIWYYDRNPVFELAYPYTVFVGIFPENDIEHNFITLRTTGIMVVKEGYAWDGSSGPTIHTKNTFRPSLVHDATYQLFRLKLLDQKWFPKANDNLRDMAIEDGMWEWRANLWHSKVVQWAMKGAATNWKEEQPVSAP